MAEEIKIVASAVGFDQVNKALESTSKTLTQTSEAATKAGKNLGSQLKTGSNQATQSLTDLSRIVQDAPYGFIGIANNINPLVESFSRLKAESGSTGGALKALLSGLSGPAGLGIAFAVVTSAITFAQVGFSAWSRSSKEAKSSTDSMDESTRNLSIDIKYLGSELNAAVKEFELIKQYQTIKFDIQFGSGFAKDIKLANLEVTQLGYSEAIAKNEFDKAKVALGEANDALYSFTQTQQGSFDSTNEFADAVSKLGDLSTVTSADLSAFNAEQKAYIQNVINASKKVSELNTKYYAYNDTISLAKLKVEALRAEEARQAAERLKNLDSITKTLAKLREDTRDQRSLAITFNTSTLKEQANLVKEAITKLITVFNVDPKNKIIIKLQADLADLNMQIRRENQIAPIKIPYELDKKVPKLPPFKIPNIELPSLEDIRTGAKLAELFSGLPINFFKPFNKSTLDDIGKTFNQAFESIAEDVAILFGQTLGDALTGQASIGDFFSGIFASLGRNLVDLGKYLVKTAIKIELIKKTLFSNPALALIGGIALIAIGRAISNATNRNAFAVGTRYAPGGMALVGERGPEMINLPRGSQVIPAAQTSQMMGGIGGAIEVFGMLRGQDIYFSNKKYGQTYKRTT
jgi:hypothetical protein